MPGKLSAVLPIPRRYRSLLPVVIVLLLAACARPEPVIVTVEVGPTAAPRIVTPTSDPNAPLIFDFTTHSSVTEPVLPKGHGFDNRWAYAPNIVYHDGLYHLFYTGIGGGSIKIGYAVSDDPLDGFEAYEGNPVIDYTNDTTASNGVQAPVAFVAADGTWVMLMGALTSRTLKDRAILRATAPAPAGPWTVDNAPIYQSAEDAWDAQLIPQSVAYGSNGYVLLYDATPSEEVSTGALRSDDGVTWEPYNDPATSDPAHAVSDPVFQPNPASDWDGYGVASPVIMPTVAGYEMFYMGFSGRGSSGYDHRESSKVLLGYATSPDGFHWERNSEEPATFINRESGYPYLTGTQVDGTYYIYYAIKAGGFGIGVVSGTVGQ